MNKAARRRWLILIAALCATLAAIFYPDEEEPVQATQGHGGRSAVTPTPVPPAISDNAAEPPRGDPDPFAPRAWQAPSPPPPEPPKAAPVSPAVEPAAPVGPPPLPFRFVGAMTDGTEQIVYLGRGEQALVAKTGDILENTYKVLSVNSGQMVFEHIPTGQQQTLIFPTRDN